MQFPRDKFKLSSKKLRMLRPLAAIFSFISIIPAFAVTPVDTSSQLIVSVCDQKLMLVQNGGKVVTYPVSTSIFGLGDAWGRMTTPLGYLAVEKKIGDNAPTGAVFHNRRFTGEVLQPNAPGRDPITTRIIWLRGLEAQNFRARIRRFLLQLPALRSRSNKCECVGLLLPNDKKRSSNWTNACRRLEGHNLDHLDLGVRQLNLEELRG